MVNLWLSEYSMSNSRNQNIEGKDKGGGVVILKIVSCLYERKPLEMRYREADISCGEGSGS